MGGYRIMIEQRDEEKFLTYVEVVTDAVEARSIAADAIVAASAAVCRLCLFEGLTPSACASGSRLVSPCAADQLRRLRAAG